MLTTTGGESFDIILSTHSSRTPEVTAGLYFESDLTAFKLAAELMLDSMDVRTEPLADTGPREFMSFPSLPYTWRALTAIAVADLGYADVQWVRDRPGRVHAYAEPEIWNLPVFYRSWRRLPANDPARALTRNEESVETFLGYITEGHMNAGYITCPTYDGPDSRNHTHFGLLYNAEPELMRRGFMTSTITRELLRRDPAHWSSKYPAKPQEFSLYEEFAEQGLQPISYMNLYNAAIHFVRHLMRGQMPVNQTLSPRRALVATEE